MKKLYFPPVQKNITQHTVDPIDAILDGMNIGKEKKGKIIDVEVKDIKDDKDL